MYLYIYLKPQKFEMCIHVKGKLKTHFFLQIFRRLYEIFYSVYGSNTLQKDILTAIIKKN